MYRTRERFVELVKESRPRLLSKALVRLNRDDAEDAVQDALIIGFENDDWQVIRQPLPWLFRVLDNVINNAQRKQRWAEEIDEDRLFCPSSNFEEDFEWRADCAEKMKYIHLAIAETCLTDRESLVIGMRLLGCDYDEIGVEAGVHADNVRATYSWAIKKIKAKMGELK